MQFIKHGPEVPEVLLSAHEEGRVVFFCGAGISVPSGLPDYRGLVTQLYELCGLTPDTVQRAAIKSGLYDTAIGLLESGHVGGRDHVRAELGEVLKPKRLDEKAMATHKALLTLARGSTGVTRLVTTNFDRLFEHAVDDVDESLERFKAPLVPVPNLSWDGIVYLHGLLSASPTRRERDRLILSSADYGRAYLTERWAARFVTELFRNFVVCFVGYGINDPILRYMMDARAADRVVGEPVPETYAFGSYSHSRKDETRDKWLAKGVTPLLYREHRRHIYLHSTLKAWSETYRDGVHGKCRIVLTHAATRPLRGPQPDDDARRVLWALSDSSGVPAKFFAELSPAPPLEWLEYLGTNNLEVRDLPRFGIEASKCREPFSFLSRPSPAHLSPLMRLAHDGSGCSEPDIAMREMVPWLARHAGDPRVLWWVAMGGGRVHECLARAVRDRLKPTAAHPFNSDLGAPASTEVSPADISPAMQSLWTMVLNGRLASRREGLELQYWADRFQQLGLTASARIELRNLLAPRVAIRAPFQYGQVSGAPGSTARVRDCVDWNLTFASGHDGYVLESIKDTESWIQVLPELLPDLHSLLCDALGLLSELGGDSDPLCRSDVYRGSIEGDSPNGAGDDWTVLVDLVRDAWLETSQVRPERATAIANEWWSAEHLLLKRLALFAAANSSLIPTSQFLSWLLADNGHYIWLTEVGSEVIDLIEKRSTELEKAEQEVLEQTLLTGPVPPKSALDENGDAWEESHELKMWRRLSALEAGVDELSLQARAELTAIRKRHPRWGSDLSGTSFLSVDFGETALLSRELEPVPRSVREAAEWLKRHLESRDHVADGWDAYVREFGRRACAALNLLSREGVWPISRWRTALEAWSAEHRSARFWTCASNALDDAPQDAIAGLSLWISYWMYSIAPRMRGNERGFVRLAVRAIDSGQAEPTGDSDPLFSALNSSVGRATEALIRWWYCSKPIAGDGLPDELAAIFARLADSNESALRHGRVLLAAHIIALYSVDPDWTTGHLVPRFRWTENADEARAVWEGYLWAPRLYRPLLEVLRDDLMETASHVDVLGKHGRQYASLMTVAALEGGDLFSSRELSSTLARLSPAGLDNAALSLQQIAGNLKDGRAEYWKNRVLPYVRKVWPKDKGRNNPRIGEAFAFMCVDSGELFPAALRTLRPWLQPLKFPQRLVHRLATGEFCTSFPEDSLAFLSVVVGNSAVWVRADLQRCLGAIRESAPGLVGDPRFKRLATSLQ